MESLRWLSFVGGFGVLGYMAQDLALNIGYAQAKLILPFVAGVAVGQLLVGFLSDRYGRVRIFVIFCNLYAIASLLCLLEHSMTLFLLFRFLSGLASPVGEITVRALIADMCDLKEGGKLFSKDTVMIIAQLLPYWYYFFAGDAPHLGSVTSSSAAVGWMAIQLSRSALVAPIFMATPNP